MKAIKEADRIRSVCGKERCDHRFSLSQNHRFWRSHILRFSCGPTSFS